VIWRSLVAEWALSSWDDALHPARGLSSLVHASFICWAGAEERSAPLRRWAAHAVSCGICFRLPQLDRKGGRKQVGERSGCFPRFLIRREQASVRGTGTGAGHGGGEGVQMGDGEAWETPAPRSLGWRSIGGGLCYAGFSAAVSLHTGCIAVFNPAFKWT